MSDTETPHAQVTPEISSNPTVNTFLAALFEAQPLDGVHVLSVAGDPNQTKGWYGGRVGKGYSFKDGQNWYYSIGVLDPAVDGRSLTNLVAHVALVFDDVGTKVPRSKLEALRNEGFAPLAIIETSPGNEQWVFKLRDVVPEDGGEACQVLAMVRDHLKVNGWGDPACFDPVRYMRVPGGINGKASYANPLNGSPFEVRLVEGDSHARVDLYALAEHLVGSDFLKLATSGSYISSRVLAGVSGPSGSLGRNASMDDPLVKLAQEVGLNPRPSTRAGVIDCDCPNHVLNGAHSNGLPEGFAFINDGMSFCNHGHCGHLNSADFRRIIMDLYDAQAALGLHPGSASADEFLAREDFARHGGGESPQELVDQAAQVVAGQERLALDRELDRAERIKKIEDRYIYVSEMLSFFDTRSYRLLTAEQFDREGVVLAAWPLGGKAKDRASVDILNRGKIRRVESVTRAPGQGMILDLPDPNGVIQRMVNTYRPTSVGRRSGVPKTWLDHIKLLYPDPVDQTYFVEAIAYALQNPHKPMPIILTLVGAPGTGKDMLIRPLMKLVGLHNCENVSPERLMSPFNDWQINRLLVGGEFTTRNHPGLHERLRDWTSPTPVWATINKKYQRTYTVQTSMWFILTTNDTDSMPGLQAGDRRFAFLYSEAERVHEAGSVTTPFTNLYFEALAKEWETEAFLETLHDYLLTLPITMFNPNQAPPRTSGQEVVARENLSRAAEWVRDQVQDGDFAGRVFVAAKELEDHALRAQNAPHTVKQGLGSRAIRDGMRAAGYHSSSRQLRTPGGARVRLWVKPRDAQHRQVIEAMTPDETKDAWTADMTAPKKNPFEGEGFENVVPLETRK